MAGATLTELLVRLHSDDAAMRCAAALELATRDDPAISAALAEALRRETDPKNARTLALALAERGDAIACPALCERLDDREAEIAAECAEALGRLGVGRPEVLEALRASALRASAPRLRAALVEAAAACGDAASARAALDDPQPEVRRAALEALASYAPASALFRAALADSEPRVARRAVELLAQHPDGEALAAVERLLQTARDPELLHLAASLQRRLLGAVPVELRSLCDPRGVGGLWGTWLETLSEGGGSESLRFFLDGSGEAFDPFDMETTHFSFRVAGATIFFDGEEGPAEASFRIVEEVFEEVRRPVLYLLPDPFFGGDAPEEETRYGFDG